MSDPTATKTSAVHATQGDALSGGRLAVLTAFAIAAASIPIPVVPDRFLARIRGAVAQDTVVRHGLILTTDARAILGQPGSDHTALRRAAELIAMEVLRRLNPVGAVTAAARGFEVYALGHLLDRYITRIRRMGAVRIHVEEAHRIRDVIDRAVRRSLSPTLHTGITLLPDSAEDLRDEFTRWIDAILLAGAAVPEYVERRLDAAFDEIALTSFTHE
jgi:hypothetical protein